MNESGRKLNSSQTDIHVRRSSMVSSGDPSLLQNAYGTNKTEETDRFLPPLELSSKNNRLPLSTITSTTLKPASFFTENIIQLFFFILGWYIFSLTISLYNKWMFDKSTLNFPFPILITSFHQLLLSILSFITLKLKPALRPSTSSSKHSTSAQTWKFYITRIIPCSLASAGDIGAGNTSFRFISLTTYTMVKSSSIAFVLFFGVLARLERFSYNLLGIVILMSFGVMLMVDKDHEVGKEVDDDHYILGFFLVLLSSCMSGLRWVFTQLLLHRNSKSEFEQLNESSASSSDELETKLQNNNSNKKNPIYTIYQLSPPMFVILFIIGASVEGLNEFIHAEIWVEKGVFEGLILLLIPGFLVFFMTFFEFGILQRAQVITLSIAGIFKELLTIVVSSFIFGDRLTFINMIGLFLTLVDIGWYNFYRYQMRLKEENEEEARRMEVEDFELENV